MPRTNAWRKYAASIQFRGDTTDTVYTLRTQVIHDALQIYRAMLRVGLYRSDSLLITYLPALERSCAIGVTKLHAARLGGGKCGLGALADKSGLKFGHRGHLC